MDMFRYLLAYFNAVFFVVLIIAISVEPAMMPARPEQPVPVGVVLFLTLALLANVIGSFDSAFGRDR